MEDYFCANTNTILTDIGNVGLAANGLKGNTRQMWLKIPENESYIWAQFKNFFCNCIKHPKHQQFNATKWFYKANRNKINKSITSWWCIWACSMNFKILMLASSLPSIIANTGSTHSFSNSYLRSRLSYFLIPPTLLLLQRQQLKPPRLKRNIAMNSNEVEQSLIKSNLLMNKHQGNPCSNIENSNWRIRPSLKLPTQQICVLMTRSPNKARMEENPVNLQDHVTVGEITGSVNALTRRKGRVTPKRNRKSPSRNFQLLLLQAFNTQAM